MKAGKKHFSLAALCLCAVLAVSGCSDAKQSETEAPVFTEGNVVSEAPVSGRIPQPHEAVVTASTDKGNSGEVTIESGDKYAVISIKDYGDIKVKLYPEEAPYAVQNFIDLAESGTYDGRNFHRIIEDFMAQGGSANGKGSGGDSFEGGSFRNEINTSLRHYYGAFCYASAMGDMSDQFYIVNNKQPQSDLRSQYENLAAYYDSYAQQFKEVRDSFIGNDDYYNYYDLQYRFYSDSVKGLQAMSETITDAVEESYQKGGTPSLDGGYTVFGQTVEGFDVLDSITAVEKEMGEDGAVSKPVNEIIIETVKIYTAE